MEIGKIGENKNTKYNHVAPIDLDIIPAHEREQALREFAEGSLGLENCLRVMWANNLKTHACCAGEQDEYDIAYITMANGVDIFSFLSEELLSSDMVALEFEEDKNRQTIRFGGTKEFKDKLMQRVADDIINGKKSNAHLIQNKIGKGLNSEWLKEGRINSMRRLGMSEEEINYRERGIELNRILETGTPEEIDAIMPEFLERVNLINQRLVEKNNERKIR